jgi:hypothetical protein
LVWRHLRNAWQAVKNVFSKGGKIFDGIKDGILNGLKAVINGIIKGINKVVSVPFDGINWALNKLRSLSILGVKPFGWISTINVPQIPLLEKGGVLKKGQIGLLEGNAAEAVVPLERHTGWINRIAEKLDEKMQYKQPYLQEQSQQRVEVIVGIESNANMMGFARALLPLLKVAEKEVYA